MRYFLSILLFAAIAPVSAQTTRQSVRGKVMAESGNIEMTRVVVYLDSNPALDAMPIPAAGAQVAQKDKAFVPSFVVIPKGTNVEFPNWDHISHNVFSRSAAAPAFDLDRYPYGMSKTRKFEKVGIVQVFCNVHPQMRAMIFVTPNVFYARCDKDGNFEIDGVPEGKYQLVAWQERCGTTSQEVETGKDVTISLKENREAVIENRAPKKEYGVEHGLGVKHEELDLPVVEEFHPAPATEPSK